MALISIILIVISLEAVAFSTQVTFTKNKGKVFVETDAEHFAMYGQVRDRDGVRVIVVAGDSHYYQTSKCKTEWESLDEVNQSYLRDYRKIREEYSMVIEESPEISKVPTERYTWSTDISRDNEKYSVLRLDDNTLVFSSKYFPSDLAKLISSGDLIIFVHHNGRVVIKTQDCLYLNEKILIRGINENLVDRGDFKLFIPSRDKAFKRYLEKHRINEAEFDLEQKFSKTYTKAEYAAMQRAVLSQGSNAINGQVVHFKR